MERNYSPIQRPPIPLWNQTTQPTDFLLHHLRVINSLNVKFSICIKFLGNIAKVLSLETKSPLQFLKLRHECFSINLLCLVFLVLYVLGYRWNYHIAGEARLWGLESGFPSEIPNLYLRKCLAHHMFQPVIMRRTLRRACFSRLYTWKALCSNALCARLCTRHSSLPYAVHFP